MLNKNINFNKNNGIKNRKIPHTVLVRWTLCFSFFSFASVKLWWVGARERTNSAFFCYIGFVWEKFFHICVSPQCIVYLINFNNIHILLYINKHYFIHFCSLFLKLSKAFSVSLKKIDINDGLVKNCFSYWLLMSWCYLLI